MDKLKIIIKKIIVNLPILRSLLYSIYFNFHYLSFRQAIKLPILLYKPRLLKLKGNIQLDVDRIGFGMIKLGFYQVSLYPNAGFTFENHGGTCVFKGKCSIGNASAISIGEKGIVIFGDSFSATAMFRLTSYCRIEFKSNVLVGWDNLFMDTDFHKVTNVNEEGTKSYAPILIGSNNWFALKSVILKGTEVPDYCIIAANSVLNKKYEVLNYSLLAGNPAKLKKKGVYRDRNNDRIDYNTL